MNLTILFSICIIVRLLLAYLISKLDGKKLKFSSIIGFSVATGFILMILINRKKGAFSQKVWWGKYRIIHAMLYLTFGLLALNMNENSYVPLVIDALLGLLFFINNRMK